MKWHLGIVRDCLSSNTGGCLDKFLEDLDTNRPKVCGHDSESRNLDSEIIRGPVKTYAESWQGARCFENGDLIMGPNS